MSIKDKIEELTELNNRMNKILSELSSSTQSSVNYQPTVISPRFVGRDYFCELTGISLSKVKQHQRNNKIRIRRDGGNVLIDIKKYYEDLHKGKFEFHN